MKNIESVLIELAMRANVVFPTNEQEQMWFDQGLDVDKSGDFIVRLCDTLDAVRLLKVGSQPSNFCKHDLYPINQVYEKCRICGGLF